jgi:hypothetical protein
MLQKGDSIVKILILFLLMCCLGCCPILRATIARPVHNPERFENYIKHGMTKDQVLLNWGKPDKIIKKNGVQYDEVWVYRTHWTEIGYLSFKDNILVDGLRE